MGEKNNLATQNCSRVWELMHCYLQSEPKSEYTEHNVPFSRNLCFCYLLKPNTLICTKANQIPQPIWYYWEIISNQGDMAETSTFLLWQKNAFIQTNIYFYQAWWSGFIKTMSFPPEHDVNSLPWFIFTTIHYKTKTHRSVMFQFSAGTEPPQWRWNYPRDQGKELILLRANSCNSWRVHFCPFTFSVLKSSTKHSWS